MKKIMMSLATLSLIGSAAAADAPGTAAAQIRFSVDVENTCNLSGSVGPVDASTATYRATDRTPASSDLSTGRAFLLTCTKGNAVTFTATPGTGEGGSLSAAGALTKSMTLAKGSDTLSGKYTLNVTKNTATNAQGDQYGGSVSFTPTAGQWNAPKGLYQGVLTVTVNYN